MNADGLALAIVDDDPSVRGGLAQLATALGLTAWSCGSAREYLDRVETIPAHCVLLDLFLPDLDGLALQRHLLDRPAPPPIIFMSGGADVTACAQAMKAGALEFLVKPIRVPELLAAIQRARGMLRDGHARRERLTLLRARLASLTPHEREVLRLVTTGHLNKQIAGLLDRSEPSVKLYRASLMRKMGADSLASLVRMTAMLAESASDAALVNDPCL